MEVPEKVSQIQSYIQCKSERVELEKRAKPLRKRLSELEAELSEVQAQEQRTLSQVDPSMLVNKRTLRDINGLLSEATFLHTASRDEFPVGCAVLQYGKTGLQLSVVFSRPLFSGWRTESPFKSWQLCPLQLDTPEPPDENHIPQYESVIELLVDLSCWERTGNELRLWGIVRSGGTVFLLGETKTHKSTHST